MISVEHIYRYPIKGFPGENLQKPIFKRIKGYKGIELLV